MRDGTNRNRSTSVTRHRASQARLGIKEHAKLIRRMSKCVVGLTSRWSETTAVLRWWFPWLKFEDTWRAKYVCVCVCARARAYMYIFAQSSSVCVLVCFCVRVR